MTWGPNISSEQCEAIDPAGPAVVRLAVDPEAKEPAHRQNLISNDVQAFTDRAAAVAVLMGEEVAR